MQERTAEASNAEPATASSPGLDQVVETDEGDESPVAGDDPATPIREWPDPGESGSGIVADGWFAGRDLRLAGSRIDCKAGGAAR